MIVSGYVSLLSQQLEKARDAAGGEYAQAAEYLDVIEHNVERCCELAHMWQRLGHAELNERKPTPAGEVLNTLAAATEPLGSAKRVAITYDLSAGTAVVEGNAAQLIRALYNIVANAVQAVESGAGGVRVSAASDDGHLAVAVEDNGCGMSEETLARIFEPYFTTRRSGQGTGLGMSIAKRIVDEHGGAITVRSAVGQGTTVTVRIPLLGRARPEAAVTAGR
jgi:signal transduction histidine kinase